MFNYDSFGSLTNETVVSVDGITSVLERYFDRFGRQTGYAIDSIQQISVAYESASGRIMSMLLGSDDSSFTWSYLSNSTLKSSLAYPNGIQAIWRYDAKDQLLQVRNTYLTNVISQYDYVYDAVGRRIQIARSGSAMSENRVDEYGYNVRNELIFAANRGESSSPTTEYAYQYDDIGNRISSYDLGMTRTYIANNLNQYTSISNSAISLSSVGTTMSQKLGEKTVTMSGAGEGFIPQFDDDGNQTIVRTTTGDWQVEYNGENRPVSWVCGETNIVMSYDIMGRRIQCVEIISSLTNSIDNFIYDGYQLISRRHIAADGAMTINRFIWDVTEPIATRPLVIYGEDNNPQYYSHDGNKNVSELISSKSSVLAHYEYAPFGMMNVVLGDFELETRNPFTFSSEYADDAIGLMYYNHRSYNPHDGRWLSKDPYVESPDVNGYIMCRNSLIDLIDVLGLWWPMEHEEFVREAMDKIRGDLPCLKDDAIYNTVVKRVVEGNAHMDALKPYKNPDANNLPLHYNRAMCQDYNKAKEIYREGLKQRRDNISSNDLGTEAKCYEALEQMGQLTHMLQDYYGHGVDESYVYQGSKISAGFGGVMFLTTEWAGKIGNSYGNPDSCENQMKPSSYSRWYLGSEHGSLFDGEPAWRAPDTSARRNSSIEVSVNELLLHMKSWCNKCCPQSNLQQLPIPTPSMIDVYNAIVEISL
jgi:RHS repeat-associated protein